MGLRQVTLAKITALKATAPCTLAVHEEQEAAAVAAAAKKAAVSGAMKALAAPLGAALLAGGVALLA